MKLSLSVRVRVRVVLLPMAWNGLGMISETEERREEV